MRIAIGCLLMLMLVLLSGASGNIAEPPRGAALIYANSLAFGFDATPASYPYDAETNPMADATVTLQGVIDIIEPYSPDWPPDRTFDIAIYSEDAYEDEDNFTPVDTTSIPLKWNLLSDDGAMQIPLPLATGDFGYYAYCKFQDRDNNDVEVRSTIDTASVVKVDYLHYQIDAGDPIDIEDGGTMYVEKDSTVTFTAIPELPGAEWPSVSTSPRVAGERDCGRSTCGPWRSFRS